MTKKRNPSSVSASCKGADTEDGFRFFWILTPLHYKILFNKLHEFLNEKFIWTGGACLAWVLKSLLLKYLFTDFFKDVFKVCVFVAFCDSGVGEVFFGEIFGIGEKTAAHFGVFGFFLGFLTGEGAG